MNILFSQALMPLIRARTRLPVTHMCLPRPRPRRAHRRAGLARPRADHRLCGRRGAPERGRSLRHSALERLTSRAGIVRSALIESMCIIVEGRVIAYSNLATPFDMCKALRLTKHQQRHV